MTVTPNRKRLERPTDRKTQEKRKATQSQKFVQVAEALSDEGTVDRYRDALRRVATSTPKPEADT